MGGAIARRLHRSRLRVVGFDRDPEIGSALLADGIELARSLDDLTGRLSTPRTLWVMLPAGDAVEETIAALADLSSQDDLIIDGGNCHYKDSITRHSQLEQRGIRFLDVGTSGGIRGEESGFCMMIGGSAATVDSQRSLFEALAPAPDRGWGRVGSAGAGHFVKMVHNGIEYGMMQAFAEGFAILDAKQDLDIDPEAAATIWQDGSVVRSWLLDLEVAAPIITASLLQRIQSRTEDSFADRLLAALRQSFGGDEVQRATEDS